MTLFSLALWIQQIKTYY